MFCLFHETIHMIVMLVTAALIELISLRSFLTETTRLECFSSLQFYLAFLIFL